MRVHGREIRTYAPAFAHSTGWRLLRAVFRFIATLSPLRRRWSGWLGWSRAAVLVRWCLEYWRLLAAGATVTGEFQRQFACACAVLGTQYSVSNIVCYPMPKTSDNNLIKLNAITRLIPFRHTICIAASPRARASFRGAERNSRYC